MADFSFKPRARIILHLGEQLIRNESVALLEIVKNSYDAMAKHCRVFMTKIDDPKNGKIVIHDNGIGMTRDIIEKVWLEPGTDSKEKEVKKIISTLSEDGTAMQRRVPLGGKGIGRFGAHKLGNVIEVISRSKNEKECHVKIDWRNFDKAIYLDDVKISVEEKKEPVLFKNGRTGTRIIISDLKATWKRGTIRNLYRAINSICPPFQNDVVDKFNVKLIIDKEFESWLNDIQSWTEVEDKALFSVDCLLEGDSIKKFDFEFKPWDSMKKLKYRRITTEDPVIQNMLKLESIEYDEKKKKKKVVVDLRKHEIGPIQIKLKIFDLDANVLKLGSVDSKGLREYLKQNGGVRVYRDGIRVLDYGEPGTDWLSLDAKRVNQPTQRIGNNLVIGGVFLQRSKSIALEEKTNREGFIENEAYEVFLKAVFHAIKVIEICRNWGKEALRTLQNKHKEEPVVKSLDEAKVVVEELEIEEKVKKKIIAKIEQAKTNYNEMSNVLLKTAGAGLHYTVAIHELDKVVSELTKAAKEKNTPDKIKTLVFQLDGLVDGYADLMKGQKSERQDIVVIIKKALFNYTYRFKAHNVKISINMGDFSSCLLNCVRNLLIGCLLNVFDNSIYWLEVEAQRHSDFQKEIYIGLSDEIEGFYSIIIADNGIGYQHSEENVIKAFYSGKADGLGLGLFIANQIMESHNGKLWIDPDVELPKNFIQGATTALLFPVNMD